MQLSATPVTYERLRHYIAERMRMSHIYQPLMLMELLGHGVAWQEAARPLAQDVARRILGRGWWARYSPATAPTA